MLQSLSQNQRPSSTTMMHANSNRSNLPTTVAGSSAVPPSLPTDSIMHNTRSKVCRSYVQNSQNLDEIMKKANEIIRKSRNACQPNPSHNRLEDLPNSQSATANGNAPQAGTTTTTTATTHSIPSTATLNTQTFNEPSHPLNEHSSAPLPTTESTVINSNINKSNMNMPLKQNNRMHIQQHQSQEEESQMQQGFQTIQSPISAPNIDENTSKPIQSNNNNNNIPKASNVSNNIHTSGDGCRSSRRSTKNPSQQTERHEQSTIEIAPSCLVANTDDEFSGSTASVATNVAGTQSAQQSGGTTHPPRRPEDVFFENFGEMFRVSFGNNQSGTSAVQNSSRPPNDQSQQVVPVIRSLISSFDRIRFEEQRANQASVITRSNSINASTPQSTTTTATSSTSSYLIPKAVQQTSNAQSRQHNTNNNDYYYYSSTSDGVENNMQQPFYSKQLTLNLNQTNNDHHISHSSANNCANTTTNAGDLYKKQSHLPLLLPPHKSTVMNAHSSFLHPPLPPSRASNNNNNNNNNNSINSTNNNHSYTSQSVRNNHRFSFNTNSELNSSFNNHHLLNNNKENNYDAANTSTNSTNHNNNNFVLPLPIKSQISGAKSFLLSTPTATATGTTATSSSSTTTAANANANRSHASINVPQPLMNYTPNNASSMITGCPPILNGRPRAESLLQSTASYSNGAFGAGDYFKLLGSGQQSNGISQQSSQVSRSRAGSVSNQSNSHAAAAVSNNHVNYTHQLSALNDVTPFDRSVTGTSFRGPSPSARAIASPMVVNSSRSNSLNSSSQPVPMSKLLATNQVVSNSLLNSVLGGAVGASSSSSNQAGNGNGNCSYNIAPMRATSGSSSLNRSISIQK